jgi:hypothetical protein
MSKLGYKQTDEHKMKVSKALTGIKRSEETKRKVSAALIGRVSPNKGKTFNENWRQKLSDAHKGKKLPPFSEEHKQKIGEANRGHKMPEEHRQRLLKINSGSVMSDEAKLHLSNKLKGRNLGPLNRMWKNGVTTKNEKIRKSLEIRLWKKSCIERDNFTCAKTGIRGGELQVHHINNFAQFPELQTSIQNGITLSKKSHLAFHKIYGYNNNTKEQLEEFLGYKLV